MKENIKTTILKEVKESIEKGDIGKSEYLLKGYLDFNKDAEVASFLANIYTRRGELKDALTVLKEQDSNYFCVFKSLTEVYIKLEKYEKLYNLWKKNKNRSFQDLKTKKDLEKSKLYLRRVQVFLKLFLDKRIDTPEEMTYKEKQYVKYSSEETLKHVMKRHYSIDNRPNINTGTIFYKKYDLEELLLALSRNIDFSKREIKLKWDFSDSYLFRFYNAGISDIDGNTLNYIRVATIPNTNKIITMFPTSNRKSSSLCRISKQEMFPICNDIVHSNKAYKVKTYSLNKK